METKHTKCNIIAQGHLIRVEGKSGSIGQSFIATFELNNDGTMKHDEEGLANAKLWASSRDLLEALIELINANPRGVDKAITDKAKQAIQKATS